MHRAPDLDDNARRIFDLRYPRKDAEGNPTEEPAEVVWRVASNVAIVTALYEEDEQGEAIDPDEDVDLTEFPFRTTIRQYEWLRSKVPPEDRPEILRVSAVETAAAHTLPEVLASGWGPAQDAAQRYHDMLADLRFLPNSPTWTGAGTPLGQLAACFVLPIEDDLGKGRDSIFETLKVAALIQQTGGGNGFSFARLRPSGALVTRSMGKASGPVAFMEAYDAAFKTMAQGGTRRGANMGVLRIDHPDVREFIRAKTVEGRVDQFNISVAVTDDFMVAVDKDEDFDLVHDGTVYETIRARDLYDEIVESAWVIGDPGNLFIDRANADNPNPLRYTYEATNPCGEQWLPPYSNCCLGSIALDKFASFKPKGQMQSNEDIYGDFDWEGLKATVWEATHFLDDVIDANQYVPAVPELEEAAQGDRRIGLGGMGLADAMAKMGLRYGSPEGQEFASQVQEFMRYWSMWASIQRAAERGPFEWIEGSIYDPNLLAEHGEGAEVRVPAMDGYPGVQKFTLWKRPEPAPHVEHATDFGRPTLDWDSLFGGLLDHGIRNATQFTWAPTGTISNVAGLNGSGCEPFFALDYSRTVMQEGHNIRLSYLNTLFAEALSRAGVDESTMEVILTKVKEHGTCQDIEEVPAAIRSVFVVAGDVTPEEHVKMQAALQAFVDNSISKTINMPHEATTEDVSRAYRLAYDLGCKGITIYRQGSRQLEVLSTAASDARKNPVLDPEEEGGWAEVSPLPLPDYVETEGLASRTHKVVTPHGTMWATITELDDHPGRPFDVRLQVGKAGNDKLADIEALGRSVSLALRGGIGVGNVVEQLEGIGGQSVVGFGPHKVKSAADGLATTLRRLYLDDHGKVEVEVLDTPAPGEVDLTRVCPNCQNATLIFEAGCLHCEPRLGGCGGYSGCE